MMMENGFGIALQKTLEVTANEYNSDRCYFFNFHGHHITYSHEWTNEETSPFKDILGTIECNDLPFFVKRLRKGNEVFAEINDLEKKHKEDAAKELNEMKREKINSLALVPIHYNAREENPIAGFIGVDYCLNKTLGDSIPLQMIHDLKSSGNFLFTIQTLFELTTNSNHPLPWMQTSFIDYERRKHLIPSLLSFLSTNQPLFTLCAKYFLPPILEVSPLALPYSSSITQQTIGAQFASKRYAIFGANEYTNNNEKIKEDLQNLREKMLTEIRSMSPDIEPYSRFRNVGYIRYMYRYGALLPLKHKEFFQVDPTANVLLNSNPRPFSKISSSLTHNKTLHHIIRTLIEEVWNNDLGPEVHVAVHPLQVRNFHEGKLHDDVYATFEGTHVDSTERVAVIMLDRLNVREGTAKTSLYLPSCPIGLRRDIFDDEKILSPLRVDEIILMSPFDTISFDDLKFKHDASNPVPDDPLNVCRDVLF